jgi:long-chain fatty acid transport protein
MTRRLLPVALCCSILPCVAAHAQSVQNIVLRNSFNPVGAGARGLGMGGAFIAVADDGTASSFNPAGLAQLRRTEIALVGFQDEVTSVVSAPTRAGIETTSSSVRHRRPDFFGLAIPFTAGGKSLTLQLSYQRAVDLFGKGTATVVDRQKLSALDPDLPDLAVDFVARIAPEQQGAFHTISVAAGYGLTRRLSLGAGINYWIAEWDANGVSDFRVAGQSGTRTFDVPLLKTTFDEEQRLRALNVNLGFLLKYPRLSIGGIVRMPFSGDYTLVEEALQETFTEGSNLPPTTESTSETVRSKLHWPRSAGVGIALRPFRGATLSADWSRSQWSRTSIDDVPTGALLTQSRQGTADTFVNRNFFDLLPSVQTATRDTSQTRAGAEYLVALPKVVVPLRVGVFRDRSPVVDFASSEGRRINGWTAGTGLNFNRLVLDVAFERRTSEGAVSLRLNQGQQVTTARPSTESVKETRMVASLIYRAGGTDDPLRRLFRLIFVGPRETTDGSGS